MTKILGRENRGLFIRQEQKNPKQEDPNDPSKREFLKKLLVVGASTVASSAITLYGIDRILPPDNEIVGNSKTKENLRWDMNTPTALAEKLASDYRYEPYQVVEAVYVLKEIYPETQVAVVRHYYDDSRKELTQAELNSKRDAMNNNSAVETIIDTLQTSQEGYAVYLIVFIDRYRRPRGNS